MQIGCKLINQFTGQCGRCKGYRAGQPVANDADGKTFVGRSPRGRKSTVMIRVVDDCGPVTDWCKAIVVAGGYMLPGHPLFDGVKLKSVDVEVQA